MSSSVQAELVCFEASCRERFPITEVLYNCPKCGGLIEAAYSGTRPAAGELRDLFRQRRLSNAPIDTSGVWRYRELWHILYSFVGERMRWLSRIFVGLLVPMGFYFAYSWLVWAALLFFFGMRHPVIYDPYPIGRKRTWLGVAALLILFLSFTLSPVRANGL